MRIAWLATQSTEDPSGLGRFLPIAQQTVRLGHTVSLIALHPSYSLLHPSERRFMSAGVDVIYVGRSYFIKAGSKKTYFSPSRLVSVSLLGAIAMAKAVRWFKPDIIHLGKPHPINGLALAFLGFPRYYVDCDDYETYSNRFGGDWQRWLVRYFENAIPKRANLITTNTTYTRDRLKTLGCCEPYLIPNAIDRERFIHAVQLSKNAARDQLGLNAVPTIVYLGTLSLVNHPVDLLLRAFQQIISKLPNAILAIVGSGEDAGKLAQMGERFGINNHIRFVGRVSPNIVPIWLRAADVTVDPVYDDPVARARSPLKVLESLVMHTPCVTGDVGDRKFILQPEQLVEPGNSRALAQGILSTLHNPPTHWVLDVMQAPRTFPGINKFVRFWDEVRSDLDYIYSRN